MRLLPVFAVNWSGEKESEIKDRQNKADLHLFDDNCICYRKTKYGEQYELYLFITFVELLWRLRMRRKRVRR